MRRHLIDRMLRRMVARLGAPLEPATAQPASRFRAALYGFGRDGERGPRS